VDCSFSPEAAVHLHGRSHSDRAHGHRHDHAHGYGHFSKDRDFGTQLEVLGGLKENTEVVMNPTDDLREGIQVQVKGNEKFKNQGSGSQSGSSR
jgi:hypothetical protein